MGDLRIYFDIDGDGYYTYFEICKPSEVLDFLNLYPSGSKVLFVPIGYPLAITRSRKGGFDIALDNIPKLEVKSMFGEATGIVILDDTTGDFFNGIDNYYVTSK